jgi:hypothetical protein
MLLPGGEFARADSESPTWKQLRKTDAGLSSAPLDTLEETEVIDCFREHLGHIQGTFWAHSRNIQGTGNMQGTFSPESLDALAAEETEVIDDFREHAGNIQGAFMEHSENIPGSFWDHSGKIQGTFRK